MPQNRSYDEPNIPNPKYGDFVFYGKYWWVLDKKANKWVCRNRFSGAREHSKDIPVKELNNLLTQSYFNQTVHQDDTKYSYSRTHLTLKLDKKRLKKIGLVLGLSLAILLFLFCGL